MSALGQKQTCAVQKVMSAFTPNSGHVRCKEECPLSAKSGHYDGGRNRPESAVCAANDCGGSRRPETPRPRGLILKPAPRKSGHELGLLDYIRNYVLRRYDYDLIFGDKEFVCSDLRHLLGDEWWKGLQFDISRYFLANFDLGAARNLLDMRVLQHDFFNDVVLLGGELDRPRRNRLFIVRWSLRNGSAEQKSGGQRHSPGCSFHNRQSDPHAQRCLVITTTLLWLFHGGNRGVVDGVVGSTGPANDWRNSMISVHSYPAGVTFRVAALALAIFVFSGGGGNAQSRATQGSASSQGPFGQLAGSWSGSGTIDLSNGRHEPIKCRASYDVLEEQNKLQLNIHCASESYNFDLRGSATYTAGAITGTWSESTRNAAGTMSGKVEGAGFQVVAKGPTFTANLNLVTRGDKQSVTIKSHDAKADVQGATITLQRG
jgi:hypothetical protein